MLKNWFEVMLLFVDNKLVLCITKPNEYGVKIFTVITCFLFSSNVVSAKKFKTGIRCFPLRNIVYIVCHPSVGLG